MCSDLFRCQSKRQTRNLYFIGTSDNIVLLFRMVLQFILRSNVSILNFHFSFSIDNYLNLVLLRILRPFPAFWFYALNWSLVHGSIYFLAGLYIYLMCSNITSIQECRNIQYCCSGCVQCRTRNHFYELYHL